MIRLDAAKNVLCFLSLDLSLYFLPLILCETYFLGQVLGKYGEIHWFTLQTVHGFPYVLTTEMKAVRKKKTTSETQTLYCRSLLSTRGGQKKKRQLHYDGDAHHVKDILMNLFQIIRITKAEALSCSLPNPLSQRMH